MATPDRLTLPMLPAPRPVEEHWVCKRSGDCCTQLPEVVMTREEAVRLVAVTPPEISLQFRPGEDNFVFMKAGPCPLFVFGGCLVYEDRPYNCRRFCCLRPSPAQEPFELDSQGRCVNLWDRFMTSRVARRTVIQVQRKAQRWARKMGWQEESSG